MYFKKNLKGSDTMGLECIPQGEKGLLYLNVLNPYAEF